MITDQQTNTVYLSALTKSDFSPMTKELIGIFKAENIKYGFLKNTEDYYCRDYMPVQVTKDKFVQFVFDPKSYFKPSQYQYISDPLKVLSNNDLIQPIISKLILDGGNVVKGNEKVIITDKVIDDNIFQMSEVEIINKLEKVLEAEVIIIPALKADNTGHADGMIRFIDDNTVFINQTGFEDEKGWEERFRKVLTNYHLEPVEMPIFEDETGSAVGIYINYLHVGNLIVIPFFNHPKEQNSDVLKLMKNHFPKCVITSVDATELAKNGGVLNCATWNILKV